jgi:hypothetical protein
MQKRLEAEAEADEAIKNMQQKVEEMILSVVVASGKKGEKSGRL